MKRTMSRLLRLHAENAEIRESDAAYIGKHEPIAQIINSIAEIFDECMRKLGITAEMSAEIVSEHAECMRKIARKIHLRIPHMSEIPVRKTMLDHICERSVMPHVG